jgi:hypothetical protein
VAVHRQSTDGASPDVAGPAPAGAQPAHLGVPEGALSTPLVLLNATPWIGIVLGLAAGGAAIDAFQMRPALTPALLPCLGAVLLLLPDRDRSLPRAPGGAPLRRGELESTAGA